MRPLRFLYFKTLSYERVFILSYAAYETVADFYRLRLGIDHPGDRNLVVGYVLNKPSPEHRQQIDEAINKSLKAVPMLLAGEWEEAVRFLHSK